MERQYHRFYINGLVIMIVTHVSPSPSSPTSHIKTVYPFKNQALLPSISPIHKMILAGLTLWKANSLQKLGRFNINISSVYPPTYPYNCGLLTLSHDFYISYILNGSTELKWYIKEQKINLKSLKAQQFV